MALSVQSLGQNNSTGAVSSLALTAAANIQAGDTVVVLAAGGTTNTDNVTSVSDGTNTYTKLDGLVGDGTTINGFADVFYCVNAAAVSSPTITVNYLLAEIDCCVVAARVGGASTSPLDTHVATRLTSTASPSLSTGALATTSEAVLAFGWVNNAPTYTESANFTNMVNVGLGDGNKKFVSAYDIVSSSSSVTWGPSLGSAVTTLGFLMSFKAVAVTPTPFSYYDFSAKPQPMKSPEFQFPWLTYSSPAQAITVLREPVFTNKVNWYRSPEFIFPNLALLENAQVPLPYLLGLPLDFYRHSPAPPKGPEFIFPDTILSYPYEVELDAIGTADTYAANVTSVNYNNLTVGTGPNRALVATVVWNTNPGTVTATWDSGGTNQVMTQEVLFTGAGSTYQALFGLVAPTSGNKTLALSWTNSVSVMVSAASFVNAAQSATFYGAQSGDSGTGGVFFSFNKNSIQDANIGVASSNNAAGGLTIPTTTGIFNDQQGSLCGSAAYEVSGQNNRSNVSTAYDAEVTGGSGHSVNVSAIGIAAFVGVSLNTLLVPYDFDRHAPPYVRGPDFIFPDLALLQGAQVAPWPQLLRAGPDVFYRHPPAPPKGPEFIFPNSVWIIPLAPLPDLLRRVPDAFYRHPPASWRTPEFIFPDVVLVQGTIVTPWPMILRAGPDVFYRHPQPYVRGPDFIFPNLVNRTVIGPVPIVATFIRNQNYVLQMIRNSASVLDQIRQSASSLAQVRVKPPTLNK